MSAPDSSSASGTTQQSSGSEPGGYAFLCQRAEIFVQERGGAAPEDVLITHVFGTGGSPALWRPLLRQALSTSDILVLRTDGYWAVPGAVQPGETVDFPDFVAVDVETTGLRPLQQRVIEVALIRFRGGIAVDRYESLCNPERKIPKYIVGLTGITDTHVEDAPKFVDVAGEVIEFIGNDLIVGHNVGFDVSFLNGELKRCGRQPLINERLDTLPLATKLIPGLRKPSLDNVATNLGLPPRKIHRAGVDAELTGNVLVTLVRQAQAMGRGTIDDLRALTAGSQPRPRDRVGRGSAVLDRSLLADVPKAPGVYLMRDQFGNVIYVGKAKNLRDRVSSYYSQPLGYTRKMDGLLESMARIDVEVVGSELQALLLESQLIKRYQPRYNTALRSYEQYPYIRVDISNPWPRITLTKARKNDGARYFGPFRSSNAARKTVDVIGQVVPLRTCPRSFKNARSYGSPCLQLDLGRCAGPCVGRADRDVYAGMVRDVVRFLDGDEEALRERIWQGLEEASAKMDFERASKLRNDLRQVTAVVDAQRQLREAADHSNLLLVQPSVAPGCREIMFVVGGRLWAQIRADRSNPGMLADRLEVSHGRIPAGGLPPISHDVIDETNILLRWLSRNDGHPAILPLDFGSSSPDWADLARVALAIPDDDVTREMVVAATDTEEGPSEVFNGDTDAA